MKEKHYILQTIETLIKEKGIEKEDIFSALKQAVQRSARIRYGDQYDLRTTINIDKNELLLQRVQEIVATKKTLTDLYNQICLQDAQSITSTLKTGEFLIESELPVDFGRMTAKTTRQIISEEIKEVAREQEYQEFKTRIGEIISGIVKRIEFGNIIIDLGRAEGFLNRNEIIPREAFRIGDRIKTYIMNVCPEPIGSQIFLSRTHPKFMAALFKQEVPEIYDGLVIIKALARDPGSRAKMAVYSNDKSLDPIGVCVGIKGSRVQAVVSELQGEKVDIINWSEDTATLIVNALTPAEVSRVIIDSENIRVEAVVSEKELNLAIGRKGQNVRLASKLTSLDINLISEIEEMNRRNSNIKKHIKLFCTILNIDDIMAHLLVAEGFESIEDIAIVSIEELSIMDGFTEQVAKELQERACIHVNKTQKKHKEICKNLGVSEDITSLQSITWEISATLGENNIKTKSELSELSSAELVEMLGLDNISKRKANSIIMNARDIINTREPDLNNFYGIN